MLTPKQIMAMLRDDAPRAKRVRHNPTRESVTVSKAKRGYKFCRTVSKSETKKLAKLFDSVRKNPTPKRRKDDRQPRFKGVPSEDYDGKTYAAASSRNTSKFSIMVFEQGGGFLYSINFTIRNGKLLHNSTASMPEHIIAERLFSGGRESVRAARESRHVRSGFMFPGKAPRGNPRKRRFQVESRLGIKNFKDHGLAAAYMLKLKARRIAYRASGPNGPMAIYSPGKYNVDDGLPAISDAEIRRKYESGVLKLKRKGGAGSAFGIVTSALYGAYGKRRVQRALAPLRAKAARKASRTRRRSARLNPVITFDLTPDEAKRWQTDIGRKVLVGRANSVYVASGNAPVVVAYRSNILATRTDSGWVFT